ncbi:MAG: BamA/TamA family outer membrane protein [Vicinamibacterales bacterium]
MRMNVSALVVISMMAAAASGQDVATKTDAVAADSEVGNGALFEEPGPLRAGIDRVSPYMVEIAHERGTGVYPRVGDMITGAGWISGGPGYRYWFGHRAFVDGSATVSWHAYKQATARFEVPRLARGYLAVGTEVQWSDLTQVHYFGIDDSATAAESEYRIKTTDVVGYATYKVLPWLAIDGSLGRLDRPSVSTGTGWFDPDYEPTSTVYPNDPGVGVGPPNYVHGEAQVVADTRDFPSYPTRGGVLRGAWSAFSDRDLGTYSFQRYEAEAARFVPVARGHVVLALHAWGVFTDVPEGQSVPFYMLPTLGGSNTLRGDRSYRWHDRDLLLVNVESRVRIFEHMDLALFADAGNVGPDVSALNLDKQSVRCWCPAPYTDVDIGAYRRGARAVGWMAGVVQAERSAAARTSEESHCGCPLRSVTRIRS